MKPRFAILSLAIAALLAPAAWAQMGMMNGGGTMGRGMGSGGGNGAGSVARHRFAMQGGIGPEYAGKRNPLPASAEVLAEGRKFYEQTCGVCHGRFGRGDGPAGKGLNPPPADLTWVVHRPFASDGYLDWSVNEGGQQFGTAMPAYKGRMPQEQIWAIIRYLQSL